MKKTIALALTLMFNSVHGIPEENAPAEKPPAWEARLPQTAVLKDGGGTLYTLALKHYHKADETIFDLIVQANPAIRDVRAIDEEQVITLPHITAASYCTKLPGGTYRVHIGTFETYASAQLHSKTIGNAGKELFIEPHSFSSQDTWYRLTMGTFGSKKDALQQASQLAARGIIFIPRSTNNGALAATAKEDKPVPRVNSPARSPGTTGKVSTHSAPDNKERQQPPPTIPDGTVTEYYENGRLKTSITYKQGVPDGTSSVYYNTGNPMFISNYSKGRKEGLSSWYYSSGTVKYEYEYKDGNLDGVVHKFYPSGKMSAVWHYKDGKREGKTTSYNRDGSIKAEWNYKGDTLDGITRIFYDGGRIQYIDTYKTGLKINRKAYDRRGKLIFEQDYPPDEDTITSN